MSMTTTANPRFSAPGLREQFDLRGYATIPAVLTPAECLRIRDEYAHDARYRSTVQMERHGFGRGEYRYFGYPLPPLVGELRETLYAALVAIANEQMAALGSPVRFPAALPLMLDLCAAGGQARSAALVLKYGPGDYNALHQDVYGEIAFPLQGTVLLSEPGREFTGGDFVLVEQRPRKQSVPHVVPLGLGDAVIFPNRLRPPRASGEGRTTFRHGVSEVRTGERFTLGLILHDAS